MVDRTQRRLIFSKVFNKQRNNMFFIEAFKGLVRKNENKSHKFRENG